MVFHEGGCKKSPAFSHNCGRSGYFVRVCSRKHFAVGQYHKHATPHAQALSINNDLPVVLRSLNRPQTYHPSPNCQHTSIHVPCMDRLLLTSYQTEGQRLYSSAGPQVVRALGEYMDNLAFQHVYPNAVNGSILHPVGELIHVAFCAYQWQKTSW